MEGSQDDKAAAPETVTHKLTNRAVEQEMKKSYIDYAMSVIVSRALPDVRDGLKPVHRRILYAMHDMGLTSSKRYMKSARVVGECFVAGTRILTERGLVNIEEVRRGEIVYTQRGKSKVDELYVMPKRKLLKVTLENGMNLTLTPSQKLKVMTPGLGYEWKDARDLTSDDVLVIRAAYPDLPYIELPPFQGKQMILNEDLAYLFGHFLSDGWYEDYNGRFCFVSASPRTIERVQKCLMSIFGYKAWINGKTEWIIGADGATWESVISQIRVNRKGLNDYIASVFGVDSSWKAPTKRIPEQFFHSPRSVLYALLSGLIDGDGHVHKNRNVIEYATVSERLGVDIHLILQHLGIMASKYRQVRKADASTMHRINGRLTIHNFDTISIEVKGRFSKLLGHMLDLADEEKSERLRRIVQSQNKPSEKDDIPYIGEIAFAELTSHHLGSGWYEDIDGRKFRSGITYPGGCKIRYSSDLHQKRLGRTQLTDWGICDKLHRIGSGLAPLIDEVIQSNLYFQHVKRIAQADEELETYDLHVEGDHEFVANGVLAHNCLGKYHPHGDTAVYDSLVRMAQDFSLRYTLVDGQGNFGSVDGDEPAAMRYTECRMDKIADEMLADIDKETIEFVPNFDGSLQEPSVLPARLPNLLVNGSSGIAVGMATNMPPHNLAEIVDGLVALLDRPELETLDLMELVKGPDFPTGGIIYGISGIMEAYSTGRGRLKVRARTRVEGEEGKRRIIVTEIPYQVNKATLIETIAELVKDKKIEGISDLRDESDREGMRIVIELKRDAMEEIVLNQLFQHTQMEATFGVINLALVNNEPKVLTLKELMQQYLSYRREIVTKRTAYELKEARKREHILVALMKAIDALDDTIRIIRESETPEVARSALMARFELDEEQAKAILDMRLQKLTGLELEGLREEFAELEKLIADLEAILASEERITSIVKGELLQLKQDYGDARKTEIVRDAIDLDTEDLIPIEDMVIMVTQDGYIKRLPLDTYKQQRRGGMGLMGMETKEEDHVTDLFVSSTHDNIMFFTNLGKMFLLKTWRIPVGGRHSKGKPVVNLLPRMEEGERVIDKLPIKDFDSSHYLVFATKKGRIKKTALDAYKNVRINGIIALGMNEGDELIDTKITDGTKEIILVTRNGRAIRFDETDVRSMGRPARGVIGTRLYEGDEVVSMAVVTKASKLLVVTERGYGKLSIVGKWEAPAEGEIADDNGEAEPEGVEPEEEERDEYRKTRRGGRGIKAMRITEKTGRVVTVLEVSDEDEILIASDSGNVVRTLVSEFRVTGRVTQGVRAKRLEEGETVIAVERLVGEHEKQAIEEVESHIDENGLPREDQTEEKEEREEEGDR